MKLKLEKLLGDVKAAYDKSDIKKLEPNWSYALITGSLEQNKPLLIGFNWGAAENKKYSPQDSCTAKSLDKEDLGSMKRVFSFCEKYKRGLLNQASQTNFCFFRSKSADQITLKDLYLCEPIFNELLDCLKPSIILCFSSHLRCHLSPRVVNYEPKKIGLPRGNYEAGKGRFGKVKIGFLPHPNYPIRGDAREEAWNFVFEN